MNKIYNEKIFIRASLVTQMVKNLPSIQENQSHFLGCENPLEKGMATHSSILAWRILWTEEPGGQQSTGSQSQTQLSNFQFGLTTCKYVSSPHFSFLNSKFLYLTSYLTYLRHLKYVQIFLIFSSLASLAILPHVGR